MPPINAASILVWPRHHAGTPEGIERTVFHVEVTLCEQAHRQEPAAFEVAAREFERDLRAVFEGNALTVDAQAALGWTCLLLGRAVLEKLTEAFGGVPGTVRVGHA